MTAAQPLHVYARMRLSGKEPCIHWGLRRAVAQQGTGGTEILPSLAEETALKMSNEVPGREPDDSMRWAFSGVGGQ